MYLYFVGKVVKDAEREMEKLISNRDLVREKVEATGTVNCVVFRWLEDVEKFLQDEDHHLLRKNTAFYYLFRCVLFPFIPRLIYSGFYDQLKSIKTLNTKCDFELFFNSIPDSDNSENSSSSFVCFGSQKPALDKLLEALQDDNTSVIRLHGKRGTGKTQLVKAVAERVKYLKFFDHVVLVPVSQTPNVNLIQDQIARSLEFTAYFLGRATADERQEAISRSLRSRRVLVILDDVRGKFVLESIGFRFPLLHCKSKVILTTRSQQEYTLMMDCEREIPLYPFSKEQAWTLFKKHSGIDENYSSSDLLNVAQQVAFECEGSPGTIIKVGSSLKSEPIDVWKESLYALRHSTSRYHIFLSFRGEDTRYSFTGFLYDALCQRKFKTFMDDGKEGLHGGDLISPSLIEAIEESRLSIIVLSENYADSSWCLHELVKILECAKMKNQLVLPIFYKVEPSDVRYQNNSYANAMVKHQNTFGADSEKIQKWKSALFEVSNLPGKTYKTGCEYEFIQEIVEDVYLTKRALYLHSMD